MKKQKGEIRVTVQREDRLKAITELSKAIRQVAEALNQSPHVSIGNCVFKEMNTGILIDTETEVTRTEIKEVKN